MRHLHAQCAGADHHRRTAVRAVLCLPANPQPAGGHRQAARAEVPLKNLAKADQEFDTKLEADFDKQLDAYMDEWAESLKQRLNEPAENGLAFNAQPDQDLA